MVCFVLLGLACSSPPSSSFAGHAATRDPRLPQALSPQALSPQALSRTRQWPGWPGKGEGLRRLRTPAFAARHPLSVRGGASYNQQSSSDTSGYQNQHGQSPWQTQGSNAHDRAFQRPSSSSRSPPYDFDYDLPDEPNGGLFSGGVGSRLMAMDIVSAGRFFFGLPSLGALLAIAAALFSGCNKGLGKSNSVNSCPVEATGTTGHIHFGNSRGYPVRRSHARTHKTW